MQLAHVNGVDLEYEEAGSGEPLLLMHGGVIGTFFPNQAELKIVDRYRLIAYRRRGYSGSSRWMAPFSTAQQAGDAKALLRHLNIERTHVAGHSYGAEIALQLALNDPALVASLSLLEPGLFSLVPSGPKQLEGLAHLGPMLTADRAEALGLFFTSVFGPNYRAILDELLPAGSFERAIGDSDTAFHEVDAIREWSFTPDDAGRMRLPVLSVIGEDSYPIAHEAHTVLRQLFPQAEELRVSQTNHALPYMSPHVVSEGIARFLDRHPL
jgi:pimeloyl-ACP methyl ester carboxylesterase